MKSKLFRLTLALYALLASCLFSMAASAAPLVSEAGQLRVQGKQLVDNCGHPIQLRGMSTHALTARWVEPGTGVNGDAPGKYATKETIQWTRDRWGANVIRAAVYSEGWGIADERNWEWLSASAKTRPYIHQAYLENTKELIRWAIELDMYVVVDWHVLSEGDPNIHKESAKKFFNAVLDAFPTHAQRKHIIWEIANEPNRRHKPAAGLIDYDENGQVQTDYRGGIKLVDGDDGNYLVITDNNGHPVVYTGEPGTAPIYGEYVYPKDNSQAEFDRTVEYVVTWDMIADYANEVMPVIRSKDPNAVIIIGTPTWSQDVDHVNPALLNDDVNVLYALHFYSCSHGADIRQRAMSAYDNGLPIFVTEWGTTEASGHGSCSFAESDQWLNALNQRGISWINWNLSGKEEDSSILQANIDFDFSEGLWSDGETVSTSDDAYLSAFLTESGHYVKRKMLELDHVKLPGSSNLAPSGTTAASSTYCSGSGLHCYNAARINDGSTNSSVSGYQSWTNASTSLPQWVRVAWQEYVLVSAVNVITSTSHPIRDFDIEYWDTASMRWHTLRQVRDNTATTRTFKLKEPILTTMVRVMAYKGPLRQPQHVRVNELQVEGIFKTNQNACKWPGIPTDSLWRGNGIGQNHPLVSSSGRYYAVLQGDSNFVVYDSQRLGNRALWAEGWNRGGVRLFFQGDGNIVMLNQSNHSVWHTNTWMHPAAHRLIMQNDGNLVVYKPGWVPVWATGTDQWH